MATGDSGTGGAGLPPSGGALVENLVVTDFLKGRFNRGQQADIYFRRDSKGLEVDLLLDDGSSLKPVEIKSGQTVVPGFYDIDKEVVQTVRAPKSSGITGRWWHEGT